MSLKPLIQELYRRRDCTVAQAFGLPRLEEGHTLPEELAELYRLCGGIELFAGSSHPIRIVGPMDFVPADPVILGRPALRSPTSTWYVLARRADDAFITIDVAPDRAGRCYDSAWDRHGVSGNCPIVARSLAELLQTVVARGSGEPWWLDPAWAPLGDALAEI